MKKLAALFLIIILFLQVGSCTEDAVNENKKTEIKVPLGDPFILLYDDTYYAYGTHGNDGIEVYTSDNMVEWEGPLGVTNGYALHKNDVWADQWFWAPEVYLINGKFLMYYSANEHICIAESDSPLGPFVQDVKKPMLEDEKCIDNSLFIDDDGTAYLSFVRFNDGNNIWIAELEDDLRSIKMETLTKCLNVSQSWEEVWPRVNEGSFITKNNGVYYMTYSANSYESQLYGIGVAMATNIMGPWNKSENNPIYQKPGDLVGVGHSAMFTDKNGQLRKVFHAHFSKTKIHPRNMYITSVEFENMDGKEVMTIDPDYITTVFKEY
ncbi:glycoside hydrolase family 43 protein [uncultured Draconibacterium sp.]|uniref:glycoside hydrolase family 43 protein n=1 Tax=uncultured Draconibacterium sp. TaxID=1573823 RepID=UPI003217DA6A